MVKFDEEEEHNGGKHSNELNHPLQHPFSAVLDDALNMNDRKESHLIQRLHNMKLESKFTKQDYVVLGCITSILSMVGVAAFYPLQKVIHYPPHIHHFITKYLAPYTRHHAALFFALLGLILLS